MKPTVIITGGAGGMGLATAKILGADHTVLLCDVTQDRLDAAAAELATLGVEAHTAVCDIVDRSSVDAAFARARELGQLRAVVHTAGVSPQMGNPEFIMRINTVGTVHVTEAALAEATEGFVLVNVASIAGYMLPGLMIPTRMFPLAATDPTTFVRKATKRASLFGAKQAAGLSYAISKAYVLWYTRFMAAAFGAEGARILSVSPGTFDTAMGRLEEKSGSAKLLDAAALKRYGKPEEVAELLAFLATPKVGYLTGVDILIDGGTLAGIQLHGAKAR